ncbi:hypothetical protein Ahy_A03g013725 isoform B [Arachis hypogaea]|uniref:Uncharacterized protein n=1 Tax=Arachis hypogaea TaxID=3818 RepID=A0A445DW18_ARAHY|nr:hypothetical protein Ahy_A03g013725 isoform B [Arachis hypogaea]
MSSQGWSSVEEIINGSLGWQEGPTWVAGTIVAINCSHNDWYYKACRRCPKKVETPVGNRYEYDKYSHMHGTASIRSWFLREQAAFPSCYRIDKQANYVGKQVEKVLEEDVS